MYEVCHRVLQLALENVPFCLHSHTFKNLIHCRQSLKMSVTLKLVCLMSAAVASSYGQSQYASYPTWLQEGAQKASEQDQSPATQGYADALGVKQDLDFLEDIDPMTATIGVVRASKSNNSI